jgi:hypothetical protein
MTPAKHRITKTITRARYPSLSPAVCESLAILVLPSPVKVTTGTFDVTEGFGVDGVAVVVGAMVVGGAVDTVIPAKT